MSEAAEHRPRDCAQYHARAKSQPGLGSGRNGKGQSNHAKDGNRPGVHDRSPADCRTLLILAISPEKDGNLRVVYARIGRCQGRPAWRGAQAAVARPYPRRYV
jgi:hypothetical protein